MLRLNKDSGIDKYYPIDWSKYRVSSEDAKLEDGVYDNYETLSLVKGNDVYTWEKGIDTRNQVDAARDVLQWIKKSFMPKLKPKDALLYGRLKKEMDRITNWIQ